MLSGDNFSSLANEYETRRDENRIDGARVSRITHLFNDIFPRHRDARFPSFLVLNSSKSDRRFRGEHLHHRGAFLRVRTIVVGVSPSAIGVLIHRHD